MAEFVLSFEGRECEPHTIECATVEDARNEAVRHLGSYLSEHPGFAAEGHWRVNVENTAGQQFFHVIVATVPARNAPQV